MCVQILGRGQLTKPLKFSAQAFSEVARSGIESAGGSIEQASSQPCSLCSLKSPQLADLRRLGADTCQARVDAWAGQEARGREGSADRRGQEA